MTELFAKVRGAGTVTEYRRATTPELVECLLAIAPEARLIIMRQLPEWEDAWEAARLEKIERLETRIKLTELETQHEERLRDIRRAAKGERFEIDYDSGALFTVRDLAEEHEATKSKLSALQADHGHLVAEVAAFERVVVEFDAWLSEQAVRFEHNGQIRATFNEVAVKLLHALRTVPRQSAPPTPSGTAMAEGKDSSPGAPGATVDSAAAKPSGATGAVWKASDSPGAGGSPEPAKEPAKAGDGGEAKDYRVIESDGNCHDWMTGPEAADLLKYASEGSTMVCRVPAPPVAEPSAAGGQCEHQQYDGVTAGPRCTFGDGHTGRHSFEPSAAGGFVMGQRVRHRRSRELGEVLDTDSDGYLVDFSNGVMTPVSVSPADLEPPNPPDYLLRAGNLLEHSERDHKQWMKRYDGEAGTFEDSRFEWLLAATKDILDHLKKRS